MVKSFKFGGTGWETLAKYSQSFYPQNEVFWDLIWLIVAPTFDTKVTEYLCSGWVFFLLQTNFDFLAVFDEIFLYHSKAIVFLSLNLKRYFTFDHFS